LKQVMGDHALTEPEIVAAGARTLKALAFSAASNVLEFPTGRGFFGAAILDGSVVHVVAPGEDPGDSIRGRVQEVREKLRQSPETVNYQDVLALSNRTSFQGSAAYLRRRYSEYVKVALGRLVVSTKTLAEQKTRAALDAYTSANGKFTHLIAADDAELLIAWLSRSATLVLDAASSPPVRCSDPNDDYLIAMAAEQNAVLVTGDRHLLAVSGSFPIHEPSDFLAMLARLET